MNARGTRQQPARQWFRDDDGIYYRNCPLIMAEHRAVMEWPLLTPGKYAILSDLRDEWDAVFSAGVTRKAELDPGDVVVTPAPFREAYPRHPGLWVLDDWPAGDPAGSSPTR